MHIRPRLLRAGAELFLRLDLFPTAKIHRMPRVTGRDVKFSAEAVDNFSPVIVVKSMLIAREQREDGSRQCTAAGGWTEGVGGGGGGSELAEGDGESERN